eukprot:364647-Chlamydomonas_euryale.AAC.24
MINSLQHPYLVASWLRPPQQAHDLIRVRAVSSKRNEQWVQTGAVTRSERRTAAGRQHAEQRGQVLWALRHSNLLEVHRVLCRGRRGTREWIGGCPEASRLWPPLQGTQSALRGKRCCAHGRRRRNRFGG